MDNIEQVTAFVVLSLAVASVPGPTSLYIFSQGLSRNWKRPLCALLGVVVANVLWVSLCSIGTAAIIRDSHLAFEILRALGCAYLIYLGVSLWKSSKVPKINQDNSVSLFFVALRGFLTSISNPKAALFYLSFLPQFARPHAVYYLEILKFGLGYIVIMMLVFSVYGFMAYRIGRMILSPGKNLIFKKTVGAGFIASALGLWKYKQA